MLSGIKILSRDQLNIDVDSVLNRKKKSSSKKDKSERKKKKGLKYDSSDDEVTEKIQKSSRSKKKWYSDEEDYSSSDSSDSEEDKERDRRKSSRKLKKNSKKNKKTKRHSSSESDFSSHSESDEGRLKSNERDTVSISRDDKDLARKEAGLDWMLKPASNPTKVNVKMDEAPEEPQVEEVRKPNPRELNPYFKDDGTGYPEDVTPTQSGRDQLLSSSVVGDGGASWRLKALKRSREQAAREERNLNEVTKERWGDLGELTVAASSTRAAPAHAHLHAINDRKRGRTDKPKDFSSDKFNHSDKKAYSGVEDRLKDSSFRADMKAPKVSDSLSWRKRNEQRSSRKSDNDIISSAAACLNKFSNDGSFMQEVKSHGSKDDDRSSDRYSEVTKQLNPEFVSCGENEPTGETSNEPVLTANQLAAKVLQLRMKGKHEEAEKLLKKQAEAVTTKQESRSNPIMSRHENKQAASRYAEKEKSMHQKRKEEDADMNLAQNIMQNKKFTLSGRADDEYDYDGAPSKKKNRKAGTPEHSRNQSHHHITKSILTQQERCQFCFENQTRPKHLTVSIGNFAYLMLPPSKPLVQGHCYILPLQHESATRNVDNNVWDDIRNFKKCLITMFREQNKEMVFLETVIGLSQQRRHCIVECIPLPGELASEAPLYFKKAIDEAEDEWSQHNAKRLIDTKEKGLRGSIPKNFPYFHVEFGLDKGFVHVIDNEKDFNPNLGLNVIRGMLELPEEDMYRRRQFESVEVQRKAVASFAKEWEPFDWTRDLA